jgi:hypothetical protein
VVVWGEEEDKVVALLIEDGFVFCCNVGEDDVDGMSRRLRMQILMPLRASGCLASGRACLCSTRRVFVIQQRRHNNLSSPHI